MSTRDQQNLCHLNDNIPLGRAQHEYNYCMLWDMISQYQNSSSAPLQLQIDCIYSVGRIRSRWHFGASQCVWRSFLTCAKHECHNLCSHAHPRPSMSSFVLQIMQIMYSLQLHSVLQWSEMDTIWTHQGATWTSTHTLPRLSSTMGLMLRW